MADYYVAVNLQQDQTSVTVTEDDNAETARLTIGTEGDSGVVLTFINLEHLEEFAQILQHAIAHAKVTGN